MARVLLDQPQSLTERPENFKPLDFGANGINGSLDWNGRIIALNWYHPQHGYVTLTSADPFPEDQRYNPSAVRAYRAGLAQLEGFGFQFKHSESRMIWLTTGGMSPLIVGLGEGRASVDIKIEAGCVVQSWEFHKELELPKWGGKMSLQRCAYSQLTEGGPVEFPSIKTDVRLENGQLILENKAIPAVVCIWGFPNIRLQIEGGNYPSEVEILGEWELRTPRPQRFINQRYIDFVYSFGTTLEEAESNYLAFLKERELANDTNAPDYETQLYQRLKNVSSEFQIDPLLWRALVYNLNMTIPVQEGICILTDHMLLPLSWNRDAYYVARALLSWNDEYKTTHRPNAPKRRDNPDIVRRHLIWMFEIAERPGGAWGRCYLANGRQKDPAFQLDQQLWPLLEFAEYVRETGDHTTFERLKSQVSTILDTLLARRKNPDAWLFPTDETPADDPIALPYHLSSHILFWRTLMKLADVFWGDSEKQKTFLMWAEHIRAAIRQYFVAEHPQFGLIYAYATDGEAESKAHFHFYHDANDFPLVLAPIWGFCGADDPIWRATIQFAWSPENEGGHYAGRLGSVHTRAAWPLADVQELIVAQTLGDADREKKARENLMSAAQWDGALPEAVDPITNAVVSRHWFAWPNAALACVELGAFQLQH